MEANQQRAFFFSAMLHGTVMALVLFFTYVVKEKVTETPKIFELVAGEGDNYMAKEAPALGIEGGIKISIPAPPAPKIEPSPVVQSAPVEAAPEPVIERAPPPTPPVAEKKAPPAVTKAPDAIPDMNKMLKQKAAITQIRKEANDKRARQIAERKAKADADQKAKEEAAKAKRMSKADFDKLNKGKTPTTAAKSGTTTKVARIDAEGIAKGVVGGSTANKVGGAGGKALVREDGDAMELYFSLLKSRLRESLDKPPGLADSLIAVVEVQLAANGTMSGARIRRSSGSTDFDEAALAAVARVRSIGPRPDKKTETITIPFRMRELDE